MKRLKIQILLLKSVRFIFTMIMGGILIWLQIQDPDLIKSHFVLISFILMGISVTLDYFVTRSYTNLVVKMIEMKTNIILNSDPLHNSRSMNNIRFNHGEHHFVRRYLKLKEKLGRSNIIPLVLRIFLHVIYLSLGFYSFKDTLYALPFTQVILCCYFIPRIGAMMASMRSSELIKLEQILASLKTNNDHHYTFLAEGSVAMLKNIVNRHKVDF